MTKIHKLLLVAASVLFYILAVLVGHRFFGDIAGVTLIVPVITLSVLYGSFVGTLGGVLFAVVNFVFIYLTAGDHFSHIYLQPVFGGIAVILVGFIVGYTKDSSKTIGEIKGNTLALSLGIERSGDAIFITDNEGVIQYTNLAFTALYGYTHEDWRGKTPRLLKSGIQTPEFYEKFWKTLSSKKPVSYEMINRKKNGDLVTVQNSANPIIDNKGKLIGFLAIQRDITQQIKLISDIKERSEDLESARIGLEDRQKALNNVLDDQRILQDELKKERDTVNLIVGSMGEGLLMINNDYKIQLINLKAQSLLDVEEKEALGKNWTEVVKAYKGNGEIPFEQRTSIRVLKTAASLNTNLEDDHYYVTPGGKKFPVTSVTTPIITGTEVTGVVKVFKDASVEKEANRIIEEAVRSKTSELKTEQEISSSILKNTGEGVVLSDSKGKVSFANPAFTDMTGYSEDEIIGKEFSDVIKAHDLKDTEIDPKEISDAAAVTAVNHEMKIQIETKNKDMIGVVINASPVQVDELYIGVVRVLHDMTEDFLLQQQKDDFFSIASHELRTPLTVISGNLDMLLTYSLSNLNESDKGILTDTIVASDRLIKLINDYLNVSRLDQGRLKYDIKELDACVLTAGIVTDLKTLSDEKNLNLSYECSGDHGSVIGDEGLIKEILINVIGNSIKFTDSGSITVRHLKDGDFLKVSITDTGIGIPENMRTKLFERFEQVHNRTLTRRAGGTGLGLYISRKFARVMGGDLILEKSNPREGSTFSFTLPLKKEPQS